MLGGNSYTDVWTTEVYPTIDHYTVCWGSMAGSCTFTADSPTADYTHTVPLTDGTWYLNVQAVDSDGNTSGISPDGEVQIDTTPPDAPGTPSTPSPTNDSTPTWTWTPSASSDVASYDVCWDTISGGCNFTGSSYSPAYTHTTPLANGTWYFKVRAVDQVGNTSAYSGVGSAIINSAIPNTPTTPTTPSPTGDNTPTWTWTGGERTGAIWNQATGSAGWDLGNGFRAIVFNGQMWVMGGSNPAGSEVWWSSDGATWTQLTAAADWSPRQNFGLAALNNQLWVYGGVDNATSGVLNDVWSSTDGITWTQVTAAADWDGRSSFGATAYNNQLWVLGGADLNGAYINEVWSSLDGANWVQQAANADWSERISLGTAVHDNKLWVLGGVGNSGQRRDVWYSTDGITWTEATSTAAWDQRADAGVTTFDGKLWVMGGFNNNGPLNDVWSSSDGSTWTLATTAADWSVRSGLGAFSFAGKLWVVGGGGPNGYLTDVWSADVQAPIDHYDFCWSATAGGCTFTATPTTGVYTHTIPLTDGTWYAKVRAVDANGLMSAYSDNGSVLIYTNPAPGTPTTTTPTTNTTPTWTWTPGSAGPTGAQWQQITANAAWGNRVAMGTAVHDGKLWVLGGIDLSTGMFLNDIWSSSDGITWTQVSAAADWEARYVPSVLSFNNQLWVMGGVSASMGSGMNDVWYSPDGVTWTQATNAADWSARHDAAVAVFDGKMWVMGGDGVAALTNDVWTSTDGTSWTLVNGNAGWEERTGAQAIIFNGSLWVMGGAVANGSGYKSDVWSTLDGVTWTQATADGGWPARTNFGVATFSDRMWVLGGQNGAGTLQDVWSSPDGTTWTLATTNPGWSSRTFLGTQTFDGRLVVIGGFDGASQGATDVWTADNLAIDHYDFCWATSAGVCTFASTPASNTYTHISELAPGTWYAKVRTVLANGEQSAYSGNGSVVILAAPSTPGTPTTTTPTTDTTPTWTWTASTGDVDHYTVCWSTTAGGCTFTATAGTTSFTHATQLANGTWYFKVQAVASDSSTSAFSGNGSVVVDTLPPTVPGVPTTTTPTSDTTPTFTWTPSTDAGAGLRPTNPYEVQWSQDPTFSSGLFSAFSNSASFTAPSLGLGTWYFRVRAFDTLDQASAFSAVFAVMIQDAPPTPTPGGNGNGTGITATAADRGVTAPYATQLPAAGPSVPMVLLTWLAAAGGYLGLRRLRLKRQRLRTQE